MASESTDVAVFIPNLHSWKSYSVIVSFIYLWCNSPFILHKYVAIKSDSPKD